MDAIKPIALHYASDISTHVRATHADVRVIIHAGESRGLSGLGEGWLREKRVSLRRIKSAAEAVFCSGSSIR